MQLYHGMGKAGTHSVGAASNHLVSDPAGIHGFAPGFLLEKQGESLIYGDPANDEQWIVEAGADWVSCKSFGLVGVRVGLDLAAIGWVSARCIRITDKGRGAQD